ncbi:MAG: hypothetical protein M3320_08010, partial [Actinomycetota bacterium]|nr:hypothetical protein [Actinomycetota bacterium]
TGFYDGDPAWSPAGGEIAFTRVTFDLERGTAAAALMAIRPDGTGLRTIAPDAGEPAWSPDGSRIAFATTRDRNGRTCFHECTPNREVYVIRADGTGERRLTNDPADDHSPTWSPDATRIAFASDRHYPAGRFPEIWSMDTDGGCLTQLTLGSDSPSTPVWWPASVPLRSGPCGVRMAPYHDGVDLAAVRVRHAVPLYPGRAFEGLRLSDAEDAFVQLGECELPDPRQCPEEEIQLQAFTVCRRHPAKYDIPLRRLFRLRGALVLQYDRASFDLVSGGTVTAIYGVASRSRLQRLVAALRPVRGPERLDRPLPRARLPRKAWRALRASARVRRGSIIAGRREMVRSDRRALRAFRRHGSRARPACD